MKNQNLIQLNDLTKEVQEKLISEFKECAEVMNVISDEEINKLETSSNNQEK